MYILVTLGFNLNGLLGKLKLKLTRIGSIYVECINCIPELSRYGKVITSKCYKVVTSITILRTFTFLLREALSSTVHIVIDL